MTIDEMIAAIEERICIRKLWRCNAGWGMFTIPLSAVDDYRYHMERWYANRMEISATVADRPDQIELTRDGHRSDPPIEPEARVERYYPSLEACVCAEYERICRA